MPLHLDMAFRKGDSKIRRDHAAENLSTLRKIASNFVLPQSRLQKIIPFQVMEKAPFNSANLKAIMTRKLGNVRPLGAWRVSPGGLLGHTVPNSLTGPIFFGNFGAAALSPISTPLLFTVPRYIMISSKERSAS